jgi:hypothetical protein
MNILAFIAALVFALAAILLVLDAVTLLQGLAAVSAGLCLLVLATRPWTPGRP